MEQQLDGREPLCDRVVDVGGEACAFVELAGPARHLGDVGAGGQQLVDGFRTGGGLPQQHAEAQAHHQRHRGAEDGAGDAADAPAAVPGDGADGQRREHADQRDRVPAGDGLEHQEEEGERQPHAIGRRPRQPGEAGDDGGQPPARAIVGLHAANGVHDGEGRQPQPRRRRQVPRVGGGDAAQRDEHEQHRDEQIQAHAQPPPDPAEGSGVGRRSAGAGSGGRPCGGVGKLGAVVHAPSVRAGSARMQVPGARPRSRGQPKVGREVPSRVRFAGGPRRRP